ncbi:alkaline phosphatase family protein [Microbacterium azadirachtae]|uniref:Type I phosphodiesterase / nucleotide pyrophosphatase n=1 Tax=Microbacterium azadirachtae TaxID=582680 RepID=A0A1I6G5Z9_9MICO|nr:alkaline phosphatase family protein [Microbacterium azadirachtae]SDL35203.1 Type I phosphodiesterase / nucleotide pyrophosphatase [Microbacterium azadirachtae]SEF65916.1 Type I phosphodiesterase / nucleotide pyrophosphatase [Microbacterium azadirachtae]SEF66689.1 Type I phosphodiesterase / nucleotide pyrophosphatase [Microbacterium azadirachtae]SFR37612.1 Type I phosphodiesterase / nucleotide pyrophosphatase [Microbacterium azadirachtae]
MAESLRLLIVVDGLRAADVDSPAMPYVASLRDSGTSYQRAVAAFPSLTRSNAAALATGFGPGNLGVLGNRVWVGGEGVLNTGTVSDVRRLRDGGAMPHPSIPERLARLGLSTVVVGNGSAGCTELLNMGAAAGHGSAISSLPEREVFTSVAAGLLAELEALGEPPADDNGSLDWAVAAAVTVIATQRPDLMIFWCGQPDVANHATGLRSAEHRAALQHADRLVKQLHTAGLAGGECDLIVTSDHGFCDVGESLPVDAEIASLIFRYGLNDGDLVLTANSGALFGYFASTVAGHRRRAVVEELAHAEWAGAVFCADVDCPPTAFPMSTVVGGGSPLVPDVIITTRVETGKAEDGAAVALAMDVRLGGAPTSRGIHGTVDAADLAIPLILHGPSFTAATQQSAPAGPADVAVTLHLLIAGEELADADGRVLRESLRHSAETNPEVVAQNVERGGTLLRMLRCDDRSYLLGATPTRI